MPVLEPRQSRQVGLVSTDGKTFPLTHAGLKSQAQGGMAHSVLSQRYRNPHAEPLEVIYTLPLPADGAVLGYTITLGERVVRGEIKARDEAREDYYKALERGHTAGLLEQERADTFTQTLGNLPPGADVQVEIEILQPLSFDCGIEDAPPSWTFRFPTVVGVRYQGEAGRVPDAAKLDAPRADTAGTPVRLELEMRIADAWVEALSPRSSSHSITASKDGETTCIQLAESSRLDRDLVLSWTAATESVRAGLVEGRGLDGDDGRYGLLTVTPPIVPDAIQPRDLTVLLDCSGSMSGAPLAQAKEVIRSLIANLGDDDRVELTAFATTAEALTREPVASKDRRGIEKLLSRLDRLQAGGATEMQAAIVRSLQQMRQDSQRQVVLITDGYIGFEGQVVGEVMDRLPPGTRLHAVGIGRSPNRSLTRAIARAGRGTETLVGDTSDVAESVDALLRGTAAPVLTGVEVTGSAVKGVAPQWMKDVFAGQPLVVALELEAEGGEVEITAKLAGHDEAWKERIAVAPLSSTDAVASPMPIGALYGRESVADCELAATASSHGSAIADQADSTIEQLGLRHRIVTRRTSLVAISEDPTVDPRDPRRRERLAVELPAGVSAEGVGFGGPETYASVLSLCSPCADEISISAVRESPRLRWLLEEPFEYLPFIEPIAARVVRRDEDELVIEFEAPDDDSFCVPSNTEEIVIGSLDSFSCKVWVDRTKSTRPGACPAGMTVRLVVSPLPGQRERFARMGMDVMRWTVDGADHTLRLVGVGSEG